MNILIDTQVFIWLINDSPRLGTVSKHLALDTSNQVFISYLSFFEMAIKANVGKLEFDPTVMQDLPKMEVDLIPGDQKSLKRYQIFDEKNKDPFDNFLIAVSLAHNLTLLTSDDKILQLQVKGLKLQDACS